MTNSTIAKHLLLSEQALDKMHRNVDVIAALDAISNSIVGAINAGNKLLLVGNGGSAADCQHIAAEFISRFLDKHPDRLPLPAIALTTDTGALTAIGNDYHFNRIFRRQVDALGKPNDILLCLSTSGKSPNVVEAAEAARARYGRDQFHRGEALQARRGVTPDGAHAER